MNSLENVKVGDKLFVSSRFSEDIEIVIKVTKLHVQTGSHKFRKDGRSIHSDKFTRTMARPATEAEIQRVENAIKRQNLLFGCRSIKFESLSDSQLEQILEIANNKES